MSAVWADTFCQEVEQWCQFPLKVYGGNVPREQLALSGLASDLLDRFSKRRFWFCQYGQYQPHLVPYPWQKSGPWMWQDDGDQYGPGPHTIPGIQGYCDNSTLVGDMTVKRLVAEWAGGAIGAVNA